MGKSSVIKPAPKQNGTTIKKPKAKTMGCDSYRSLVSKYDWDVNTALAVMRAESGCNPKADNTGMNNDGSNDKGLFQINSIHVQSGLISDKGRLDPEKNIKAAYAIYRGSGWRAWAAVNNGSYMRYL